MSRILLIGGHHETVVSVAELLAGKHCQCEIAAGRADALRRLRAKSFDVVVSDPVSSVDEDLAMLDEMRRIQPGIKVIILSAHAAPEDVIAALRARVFGYFSQPFDAAAITAMAIEASEKRSPTTRRISSAVRTSTRSAPAGVSSITGPLIKITFAPRFAAASATA